MLSAFASFCSSMCSRLSLQSRFHLFLGLLLLDIMEKEGERCKDIFKEAQYTQMKNKTFTD